MICVLVNILYYMFVVLLGCPLILQSDPGTENCIMGALQCVLRHNATDIFAGFQSYRIHVVRSVFNQVNIQLYFYVFV